MYLRIERWTAIAIAATTIGLAESSGVLAMTAVPMLIAVFCMWIYAGILVVVAIRPSATLHWHALMLSMWVYVGRAVGFTEFVFSNGNPMAARSLWGSVMQNFLVAGFIALFHWAGIRVTRTRLPPDRLKA